MDQVSPFNTCSLEPPVHGMLLLSDKQVFQPQLANLHDHSHAQSLISYVFLDNVTRTILTILRIKAKYMENS